eukprot:7232549-Karenia_brevis.AAC.1
MEKNDLIKKCEQAGVDFMVKEVVVERLMVAELLAAQALRPRGSSRVVWQLCVVPATHECSDSYDFHTNFMGHS